MDDEVLVRVGERIADALDERHALAGTEAAVATPDVFGCPSTKSITKYGTPSSVVPASSRCAIPG